MSQNIFSKTKLKDKFAFEQNNFSYGLKKDDEKLKDVLKLKETRLKRALKKLEIGRKTSFEDSVCYKFIQGEKILMFNAVKCKQPANSIKRTEKRYFHFPNKRLCSRISSTYNELGCNELKISNRNKTACSQTNLEKLKSDTKRILKRGGQNNKFLLKLTDDHRRKSPANNSSSTKTQIGMKVEQKNQPGPKVNHFEMIYEVKKHLNNEAIRKFRERKKICKRTSKKK